MGELRYVASASIPLCMYAHLLVDILDILFWLFAGTAVIFIALLILLMTSKKHVLQAIAFDSDTLPTF